MGEEKVVTKVIRFPENVDRVVDVLPEFLKSATAFLQQATTTVHDLDALAPGNAVAAMGEFFEAATDLMQRFSKSQESTSTIPTELKEVRQSLNAMSNTMKGFDKRMKNVESQRQSTEKHDAVVPGQKGWRDGTLPHNKGSRFERGNKTPAIPTLPPLKELQPQNANEQIGDALHTQSVVPREDSSRKGPEAVTPFNTSLGNQLQTKVKASGT